MIFDQDIIEAARENSLFRKVIKTGAHAQVVLMSIPPLGEIGNEVHADVDQILLFVEGVGQATVGEDTKTIGQNHLVFVPAGTWHNFTNTGSKDLRLVSVYAPPEHPDGTVHRTKEEADKAESEHQSTANA